MNGFFCFYIGIMLPVLLVATHRIVEHDGPESVKARSDYMVPELIEVQPNCACHTDMECMELYGGDGYDGR